MQSYVNAFMLSVFKLCVSMLIVLIISECLKDFHTFRLYAKCLYDECL